MNTIYAEPRKVLQEREREREREHMHLYIAKNRAEVFGLGTVLGCVALLITCILCKRIKLLFNV